MKPRSKRTAAAISAVALVSVILGSLVLGEAEPPPRLARPATAASPLAPPRRLQSIETYAAMSERPLFTPTRRPAPPPPPKEVAAPVAAAPAPPAPPAPPPVPPQVTLLAVAIGPDRREAVLRLSTGTSTTLAEGDQLDGWLLASVQPSCVIFRQGEIEQEVAFPVAQVGKPALFRPSFPPPRH